MEAPFRPLLLYHSSFIHTHESHSFFIAPSFADVVVSRGYISRYLRRVYAPAFSPSLMGYLTFAKSTILEVVEKRFSGGLSELEQRLPFLRLICFLCMSGAWHAWSIDRRILFFPITIQWLIYNSWSENRLRSRKTMGQRKFFGTHIQNGPMQP